MRKLLIAFITLWIVLSASFAMAADIGLAWDANTETITGYRVYAVEASGDYDYSAPVYDGTATTATITGLPNSTEIRFVVRAYLDIDGAIYESENSNEVKHAVVVWVNPNLRIQ